jgi:hypothetical protein
VSPNNAPASILVTPLHLTGPANSNFPVNNPSEFFSIFIPTINNEPS